MTTEVWPLETTKACQHWNELSRAELPRCPAHFLGTHLREWRRRAPLNVSLQKENKKGTLFLSKLPTCSSENLASGL